MAIDDVISNYDTDVSNGTALSLQPASGDEWLVKQMLMEGSSGWELRGHTNTAPFVIGQFGGDTGPSLDLENCAMYPVTLFVTNTEYVKMFNNSGSTDNAGYSAIKTKE